MRGRRREFKNFPVFISLIKMHLFIHIKGKWTGKRLAGSRPHGTLAGLAEVLLYRLDCACAPAASCVLPHMTLLAFSFLYVVLKRRFMMKRVYACSQTGLRLLREL